MSFIPWKSYKFDKILLDFLFNLRKSIAIAWYWVWINLILFDIAFVSLCKKIFLLLFDIVNLHFATFTNYLYCLLKIKVLDYCLVAFGHKKMQFCPTLLGLEHFFSGSEQSFFCLWVRTKEEEEQEDKVVKKMERIVEVLK